jgi:hypothetical protein
MKPDRPPSEGLPSFGMIRIEGESGVISVALHDGAGKALDAVDLSPGT